MRYEVWGEARLGEVSGEERREVKRARESERERGEES